MCKCGIIKNNQHRSCESLVSLPVGSILKIILVTACYAEIIVIALTVNLDVSYQLCLFEKLTQCNLFFNSTMNSRKNKKKR